MINIKNLSNLRFNNALKFYVKTIATLGLISTSLGSSHDAFADSQDQIRLHKTCCLNLIHSIYFDEICIHVTIRRQNFNSSKFKASTDDAPLYLWLRLLESHVRWWNFFSFFFGKKFNTGCKQFLLFSKRF